jgi:antitoxin HigA-1
MARTPIHPGEHLAEELKELRISAAELARQIDVPVNRVTSIINGQRAITADTALRLGHWFGTSAEFWLNLQKLYECGWHAKKSAIVWKNFLSSRNESASRRGAPLKRRWSAPLNGCVRAIDRIPVARAAVRASHGEAYGN